MKTERLQQISFAEGFVEDFIESSVAASSPDVAEQAMKLTAMWQTLTAGLKELRSENADLEAKLILAKNALG